jgi:hypothetical protein
MRAATFTVNASGLGRLSTMARPRGGEWLEDEMASLRQAGTDVLVCMLTVPEMRELDLTEEAAVAEAAGIHFIGLPTLDRGTPDLQQFRAVVAELAADLEVGKGTGWRGSPNGEPAKDSLARLIEIDHDEAEESYSEVVADPTYVTLERQQRRYRAMFRRRLRHLACRQRG